jgi:hypothetical protein
MEVHKILSSPDVKLAFYGEEQQLAVSHLVFQVLEWAQTDVRQVALSSLNLIDTLCVGRSDRTGDDLYRQFVECFCRMLPGITTKLVKTLQGSIFTKHHFGLKLFR